MSHTFSQFPGLFKGNGLNKTPNQPLSLQSKGNMKLSMPQDLSRANSFSQPTTNSSISLGEISPQDGGRSQARFQELVARTRHLETLEILHDIKKRLTNLEEVVYSSTSKVNDSIYVMQKHVETNIDSTNNINFQNYQSQAMLLTQIAMKIETFNEKLTEVEKTLKEYPPSLPNACYSPKSDDGLSLQCYLKRRTKSKPKPTSTIEINDSENTIADNEGFDPMTDTFEFQDHSQNTDNDLDDKSSVCSHMTEPIRYKKSKRYLNNQADNSVEN